MCEHALTRRRLLCGAALAGATGVAGCLGGDESGSDAPDSVSLDDRKACDICGMIIEDGYGPNGQVAFDDEYPTDRDGPAWYDSVRELYVDRFAQESRGIEPVATYVTDYATAEYELETVDGDRYITGSIDTVTFVEASKAVFVIDSGVAGAMGAELLPFSDGDAADAFVDAENGEVIENTEITRELVESL